jgi:hypothetical protein
MFCSAWFHIGYCYYSRSFVVYYSLFSVSFCFLAVRPFQQLSLCDSRGGRVEKTNSIVSGSSGRNYRERGKGRGGESEGKLYIYIPPLVARAIRGKMDFFPRPPSLSFSFAFDWIHSTASEIFSLGGGRKAICTSKWETGRGACKKAGLPDGLTLVNFLFRDNTFVRRKLWVIRRGWLRLFGLGANATHIKL